MQHSYRLPTAGSRRPPSLAQPFAATRGSLAAPLTVPWLVEAMSAANAASISLPSLRHRSAENT